MRIVYFFAAITLVNGIADTWLQNCPRVLITQEKKNETGRWYGYITLASEDELFDVWIRLVFDKPTRQLGNWFGPVVTTDNQNYLIEKPNYHLAPHTPLNIRFFVECDPTSTPAQLVFVTLNGRAICPKDAGSKTTTTVEAFTSGYSAGSVTKNPTKVTPPTTPPTTPRTRAPTPTTRRPPTTTARSTATTKKSGDDELLNSIFAKPALDSAPLAITLIPKKTTTLATAPTVSTTPSVDVDDSDASPEQQYTFPDEDICGTVIPQPKPLVSHGTASKEAEFPWHAAIYNFLADGNLEFFCGGSVISKQHVLTAARCITQGGTPFAIFPQFLLVYLGKYRVRDFSSPNVQLKAIQESFIHPKFEIKTFTNDIAVMKLAAPADITDYVRPICLWKESTSVQKLLNKYGRVAGWDLDENGNRVDLLSYVDMPVVSVKDCRDSFPAVYTPLTAENTFCGGNRNGSTICQTDAGGGLVFPMATSNPLFPRWQIRGVAAYVPRTSNVECDLVHYTVFTDVAKYLGWIAEVLQR